MDTDRPVKVIRGRGTTSQIGGRFAPTVTNLEPEPPPAPAPDDEVGDPAPLTELIPEQIRTIISRNTSPDIPFSQSLNPYRGCEHGCVYCYARPAHAYMDLSPGLDFERKIFVKREAAARLREELSRPGYRCEEISLGANTDAYQPAERRLGITRQLLAVLGEFGHPVSIITKSALVERDLDLLGDLAARNLVIVMVSITTLDDELKRRMEPRTASPRRRLEVIRRLAAAGIPCGVMAAPMIPGLNDHELERILEAAAAAGARHAGYVLLRLPYEVEPIFVEWLGAHYPLRAAKVQNLLRQARGGRLNDPRFGSRMRGEGPLAALLARRFAAARERYGFTRFSARALATDHFRVPPAAGQQLDLLGPGG